MKETWTCDWIYSLPKGAVLWDVGANIGIMTLIAAACENVEAVVAIEPFSANYDAIVRNARQNGLSEKVVVVAGGLSDRTGFFPLNLENVTPGGALHSFGSIAKIGDKRTGESVGRQMCAAYRMDDLVRFEGIPFPTHVKVDVDGFEERLLKGAEKVLRDPRVKGVQIETLDPAAAEARTKNAVTRRMREFGFELARECVHPSSKASCRRSAIRPALGRPVDRRGARHRRPPRRRGRIRPGSRCAVPVCAAPQRHLRSTEPAPAVRPLSTCAARSGSCRASPALRDREPMSSVGAARAGCEETIDA